MAHPILRAIGHGLRNASIVFLGVGVALLFFVAIATPSPHAVACKKAGGHYTATIFTDECWSADGTRRIFPWESTP